MIFKIDNILSFYAVKDDEDHAAPDREDSANDSLVCLVVNSKLF